MSRVYQWQNLDTGEIQDHSHWSVPPTKPGRWVRRFSFYTGKVKGAGGSPGGYASNAKSR